MPETNATYIELSADIVAAYVAKNSVTRDDLPALIANVHIALSNAANGKKEEPPRVPAVPIKQSIKPDYIVCLDTGKKFKSMKRHLTGLGMTPEQYRARWDLPVTYPMVAPNYAAARSALARSIGLGQKAAGRKGGKKKAAA